MTYLFYILTPILTWVLEMIFRGVFSILSAPLIFLQERIDNNRGMFKFRADMVFSGFCAGFTTVYLVNFANIYFDLKIVTWWIICSVGLIIAGNIFGWDRNKPILYEISLNVPPWIGYTVGILLFLS